MRNEQTLGKKVATLWALERLAAALLEHLQLPAPPTPPAVGLLDAKGGGGGALGLPGGLKGLQTPLGDPHVTPDVLSGPLPGRNLRDHGKSPRPSRPLPLTDPWSP